MKLSAAFGACAIIVALCASIASTPASAQTGPCRANPSPVNAADPSIVVTSPAAGASVASPIHVTGQARVFEATVSLKLFDASGTELRSTTANAAEGGVLSAFSADVSFGVTSSRPACLWVFEASAQDGRPTNVVQIPLTLLPAGLPQTGMGSPNGSDPLSRTGATALAAAGAGLAGLWWLARRRAHA